MDRDEVLAARTVFRLILLLAGLLYPAAGWSLVTYTVSTTADSGAGSLRSAMQSAVADGDHSLIQFTASGTIMIGMDTSLPLPDHNEAFSLELAAAAITLDGSILPSGNGLTARQGSLIVNQLAITHMPGNGIELDGSVSDSRLGGTSACTGIPNITISGSYRSGVIISGANSRRNQVRCALISGNGDDGVTVLNFSRDNGVFNSTFVANTTNGIKFSGNSLYNTAATNQASTNSQSGILIGNGSHHNTVGPANSFSYNFLDGVQIDGIGSDNNTVTDNTTISSNDLNGISISNGAQANTVWNNGPITKSGFSGIALVYGAYNNSVHKNTIDSSAYGIFNRDAHTNSIGKAGAGNTIQGVTIGLFGQSSSPQDSHDLSIFGNSIQAAKSGIYLTGTMNQSLLGKSGAANTINGGEECIYGRNFAGIGNLIQANSLQSCSVGVLARDSSGFAITSNTIVAGNHGVLLYNSANIDIGSGNDIRNSTIGVHLANSTAIQIHDNVIHQNGTGLLSESSSAVISDNNVYLQANSGIVLRGTSAGGTVEGNIVRNSGNSGGCPYQHPDISLNHTCWPGILVWSGASEWTIGSANRIYNNPIGIMAYQAAPVITANKMSNGGEISNNITGIRIEGATSAAPQILDNYMFSNLRGIDVFGGSPVIQNNQFANNTEYGVQAEFNPSLQTNRFYTDSELVDDFIVTSDIGATSFNLFGGSAHTAPPYLFSFNIGAKAESSPVISGNDFTGNSRGIKVMESIPGNMAALAAGTSGNTFSGESPEIYVGWYGVIGGVLPDGNLTPVESCRVVFTDEFSTPGSDAFCPPESTSENNTGVPRSVYVDWLIIPQLIQESGIVTAFNAATPQLIEVTVGGKTFSSSFSFDGNSGNDVLPFAAPSEFNNAGHFQAALITVSVPPSIVFADATTMAIYRSEITSPLYLWVTDGMANLITTALDSVTAAVTDVTTGEKEVLTLLETGPNEGTFVGLINNNPAGAGLDGDGVFAALPGERLHGFYTSAVNVYQEPVSATVDLWEDKGTTIGFYRNNKKTDRIVIDASGEIRVTDYSANISPVSADTIFGGVTLVDGSTGDQEVVDLTETGPSTNVFTGTFDLYWEKTGSPGDGRLAVEPGQTVVASYMDPTDPKDLATASAKVGLAHFQAVVKMQNETGDTLHRILPDQMIYVSILDRNRSLSVGAESIDSAVYVNSTSFSQAINKSTLAIYSMDAGGTILDWEALHLQEKNGLSAEFKGQILTNRTWGKNETPGGVNHLLWAPAGSTVAVWYIDHSDVDFPDDQTTVSLPVAEEPNGRRLIATDRTGFPVFRTLATSARDPLPFWLLVTGVTLSGPTQIRIETDGHANAGNRWIGQEDNEILNLARQVTEPAVYHNSISQVVVDIVNTRDSVLNTGPGILYHAAWLNPSDATDEHHFSGIFCSGSNSRVELLDEASVPTSNVIEHTPFRIRITDPDKNVKRGGKDVVIFDIGTSRDSETLAGLETGANTGIFEARITPQSSGQPVTQDGTLTARLGELVTVNYQDDTQIANPVQLCRFADHSMLAAAVINKERSSFIRFRTQAGKEVHQLQWGESYQLELLDTDANHSPTITESATLSLATGAEIPGDSAWQRIALLETGASTGVFRNSLSPEAHKNSTGFAPAAISTTSSGIVLQELRIGDRVYVDYQDPEDSNDHTRRSIAVAFTPLRIRWNLSASAASLGDMVRNVLLIDNPNAVSAPASELILRLPPGLRMHPDGTHASQGISFRPSGDRDRVVELPQMAPGQKISLQWVDAVPPGAEEGIRRGAAEIQYKGMLISNRVRVELEIVAEPLFEQGTLLGRIFYDSNDDGWMASYEKGVTGAVLYTNLGHRITADAWGRFHVGPLLPGNITVKPDPAALPPGAIISPPVATAQIWPGEMSKLNFAVRLPSQRINSYWERIPYQQAHISKLEQGILLTGSLSESFQLGRNPLAWRWVDLVPVDAPDQAFFLQDFGTGLRFLSRIPDYAMVLSATIELTDDAGILRSLAFLPEVQEQTMTIDLSRADLQSFVDKSIGYRLEVLYRDGVRASTPVRPLRIYEQAPTEELAVASHFEKGSHSLEPITILNLREAADLLRSFPKATVVIEGHTDDSGPRDLNLRLSTERAEKGKAYLRVVEEIEPGRITAIGYGPDRPLVSNDSDEHRSTNRRVVVKVIGVPKMAEQRFKAMIRSGNQTIPVDTENDTIRALVRPGSTLFLQDNRGRTLSITMKDLGLSVRVPEHMWVREPDYSLPITISAPRGAVIKGDIDAYHGVTGPATYMINLRGRKELKLTVTTNDGTEFRTRADISLRNLNDMDDRDAGSRADDLLWMSGPPEGTFLHPDGARFTGFSPLSVSLSTSAGTITRSADGRFELRTGPLSEGQTDIKVSGSAADGKLAAIHLRFPVQRSGLLAVGSAEVKGELFRQNQGTEAQPDGQGFLLSGQGAALLTGTLTRGTRMTIWAGLREEDPEGLVKQLTSLNSTNPLTPLAIAERSAYPTYGDEATVTSVVAPIGPLYVDIEHGASRGGWGRFRAFQHTFSLLQDSDQSAGAWFQTSTATDGLVADKWQTRLGGWIVPRIRGRAEDRFQAVGTSLYLLRHNGIIPGTEQIDLAAIDPRTGLAGSARTLVRGEDYRLDYDLGQVILLTSVPFLLNQEQLIVDAIGGSTIPLLVVRYEYLTALDDTQWHHHEEISQQIGSQTAVSGYYQESRNETDVGRQTGSRIDFSLGTTAGANGNAAVEWGHIFSGQREEYFSRDGGFSWSNWATGTTLTGVEANALAVQASTTIGPIQYQLEGGYLEPGYYGSSFLFAQQGLTLVNRLSWSPQPVTAWSWGKPDISGVHRLQLPDVDGADQQAEEVEFGWALSSYTARFGAENRHGFREQLALGAAEFGYHRERWKAFIRHQQLLSASLNPYAIENFISTVGGGFRPWRWLQLSAALSLGSASWGGEVQTGFIQPSGDSVMLNSSYRTMRDGSSYLWGAGLSGQQTVNKRLTLTAGQQFSAGNVERGWLSMVGSDLRLLKGWQVRGRFSKGRIQRQLEPTGEQGSGTAEAVLDRTVLGAGTTVRIHGLSLRSDIEQRRDDNQGIASPAEKQQNWWTNIHYRLGRDVYTLATAAFSRTLSDNTNLSARSMEVGAGLGYRPVDFNALDWLGMIRWLSDLEPVTRDQTRSVVQSLIVSSDMYLQLPFRLFTRGKGAFKFSGIEVAGEPINLSTMLLVAGSGWRFWKMLYAYGEYRYLYQFQTRARYHGPTAEFGINPQPWVYIGLGYNFSQIDDQLYNTDPLNREGIYARMRLEF